MLNPVGWVYITVLSALTNSKLVIPCCIDLEWTNDLTKKKSEYLCYQRYIKLELKTNNRPLLKSKSNNKIFKVNEKHRICNLYS
jgi:hypothetical protein